MNLYQYVDSVGKPSLYHPNNFTNTYNYTANNPINRVDPLGLWYIDINFTWVSPWGFGGTVGIMLNGTGYWSYTGGAAGLPGATGSVTYSNQNPSSGSAIAATGGLLGAGYQQGLGDNGESFEEFGGVLPLTIGTFGSSIMFVDEVKKWPWNKNDQEKDAVPCP